MRYNAKVMLSFCLMVLTAWMTITAFKWPLQTAIFPLIIGIPVFFMSTIEFCLSILGKEGDDRGTSDEYFKVPGNEETPLLTRRFLLAFIWIFGLFLLILLFGFVLAIPLFVLLHLKLHGREKWGLTLGLTFVTWGVFYCLFVKILHVPFQEGLAQRGLRALGVG